MRLPCLLGIALNLWSTIFFDGWWTLFLLIPAVYSFINDGFRFFNSILFLTGIALLLPNYVDGFKFGTAMYIFCAVLLVILALRIVFSPFIKRKKFEAHIDIDGTPVDGSEIPGKEYNANFSSKSINFNGKEFNGARINVSFGSIKLDLRGAVISHDAEINVDANFSGVEILLPDNIGIDDKCKTTFGGVETHNRISSVSPNIRKSLLPENAHSAELK